MIKNIIFDFGDVFIDLDKEAPFRELARFGFTSLTPELDKACKEYEMGSMNSNEFISILKKNFPSATETEIIAAWNSIILDFPEHRLVFLEQLKSENDYRLFLLSNTNALHIEKVVQNMGTERYERFKNCFEQFYLSHEIQLRKPNATIYEYVLKTNDLNVYETFFVDDTKENTDAAQRMGIFCWNLQVGEEDIVQLKNKL
ncbi:HAD-IA family hydrolase [Maribacter sp. 2210JD10-5]|uniref:HAD-IA family hydrolase n=1 Tax=Maribacter sp. 2210JD10-5 TaxID=3386272 RepID=UPI0039BD7A77